MPVLPQAAWEVVPLPAVRGVVEVFAGQRTVVGSALLQTVRSLAVAGLVGERVVVERQVVWRLVIRRFFLQSALRGVIQLQAIRRVAHERRVAFARQRTARPV